MDKGLMFGVDLHKGKKFVVGFDGKVIERKRVVYRQRREKIYVYNYLYYLLIINFPFSIAFY